MDHKKANEEFTQLTDAVRKLDESRKDSLLYLLISMNCHGHQCNSGYIQEQLDELLIRQARSDSYGKLLERVVYYTKLIKKYSKQTLKVHRLSRLKRYRHGMQLLANNLNTDLGELIRTFDRGHMDESIKSRIS
ncbi:MAG: hypothetical protein ACE3JQ_02560 [Paenisporosarcina sp.]